MKRRDIWIIGAVAVLAGLLLLLGQVIKPAPPVKALPTLSITNAREPDSGGPLEEANSYLRIRQGQEYYHLVPLNGPGQIVIRQDNGWENVIYIDKDSVVMHSANCHNQDCVNMGEMTLSNIDTRVFQRWIVCLAHQISLELMPREEALRLMEDSAP